MNSIHLTLASQSPRRKELLALLDIPFQCWAPSGKEESSAKTAASMVQEIARGKAMEAVAANNTALILTADTLVAREGQQLEIFGKPQDKEEALAMLRSLAGELHQVYTAVCLYDRQNERWIEKCEISTVHFCPMQEEEIKWVLAANEWQDAAGGYMIQGRTACFIEKIVGSYSNILGLPIHLLYSILSEYDYLFEKKQCSDSI